MNVFLIDVLQLFYSTLVEAVEFSLPGIEIQFMDFTKFFGIKEVLFYTIFGLRMRNGWILSNFCRCSSSLGGVGGKKR